MEKAARPCSLTLATKTLVAGERSEIGFGTTELSPVGGGSITGRGENLGGYDILRKSLALRVFGAGIELAVDSTDHSDTLGFVVPVNAGGLFRVTMVGTFRRFPSSSAMNRRIRNLPHWGREYCDIVT